ncbi:MAG: peptidase S10 [Anaerolineae bacterium]|nr:peptidase S10 [Anaerolineae bacterium]
MAKDSGRKPVDVASKDAVEPDARQGAGKRDLEEITSETKHTVIVGGQEIGYTAKAGTLILKDDEGSQKASVFYVAYTKNNVEDVSQRPITFSFNGGPGSSSVWLHLGVLGPQRVLMNTEGDPLPPPFKLVNNEYSLLDVTDLVFIDPVSTGYSRPAPGEEAKQFHGVEQDVESVGEFIRLFTTRSQRWHSPKFLIGESYGTTRAAGLSSYLQEELGMYVNGIMLVSAILNFQTARFTLGNDLPYVLFLPTYAATAWYHHRLPQDLQALGLIEFLSYVEAFARGAYNAALMQGSSLSVSERAEVVAMLARYTGLAESYIEQTNLRINIHRFVKELLRDERRTIGRFDSRIKGIDRDAAGESHAYDPSYAIVQGAYTAALNHYVRSVLDFKSDQSYAILTDTVQPWDYSKHQNEYLNVAESLRQAITYNPYLRVFVGNGYYDLATPYFATQYTFSHLELDPTLEDHVTMGYYEAGHMMYLHQPSLAKLKADLAGFVAATLG